MEYKTQPRKPTRDMPSAIILMASGKMGKSANTAKLTTDFARGKAQVISLGVEGGYDMYECNEINFTKYSEFDTYIDNLIKDQPYDFIILDHLSTLDEWSEMAGTLDYMSSGQGKSFNLKAGKINPEAKGPGLTNTNYNLYFLPGDKDFQSVHTLAKGSGYYWSRRRAIDWYNKIKRAAPYVIFNGHPKIDRYTKDDTGKIVNSAFLDVTNGVSRFICKDIDAIASLYRKKDKAYLSFKHGTSDLDAGCRYDYLEGEEILISEMVDGNLETYWEKIYPNYKK